MLVQRHDFAVDDTVGQTDGVVCNGAESVGPIKTGACADDRSALFNLKLRSIAVEFDLVCPAGLIWRAVNQLAELRLNELWHLSHRDGLHAFRGCGFRRLR